VIGPGKYDAECETVREVTRAAGVMICVLDGRRGNGISVSIDGERYPDPIKALADLPAVLRSIADAIEADARALS